MDRARSNGPLSSLAAIASVAVIAAWGPSVAALGVTAGATRAPTAATVPPSMRAARAATTRSPAAWSRPILAVGAENEYANVISQLGGRYVRVDAIMSNPNTDPHEFEASRSVAQAVSQAQLIVQNGAGYDTFMDKIEAASTGSKRVVIVAQQLLATPAHTFNPHLWYDPMTMPAVAKAVAAALSSIDPAHKSYYLANEGRFTGSLRAWADALAAFKKAHPATPVAVTEPVCDFMLQAAGARILTPEHLQSSVMNGTDPSPQDITIEDNLLGQHKVKVFLYNRQVTDSLTANFLGLAKKSHVPVVGVYETMPAGYQYQSWMLAETEALQMAVAKRISTERL